jgi:hypothetical protein
VKTKAPASTHKKVVVQTLDGESQKGYLNPSRLGRTDEIDLLTPNGSHLILLLKNVRCIFFVREFADSVELQRKAFLSRPKLDGLWVRLRFRDQDELEGIVPNNLLELLDRGVHLTPPDLHGDVMRIFIPSTALSEMTVVGVVGAARRATRRLQPAEAARQPRLFGE